MPRLRTALVLAAAIPSLAGCASQVVNWYARGRPLGPGHMEAGMSLSWARQPTKDVAFREEDVKPEFDEPLTLVPVPVWHFRLGVLERLDAGLDVSLAGAALSGKYAVFDTDDFMMAVAGRLGTWTQAVAGEGDASFSAVGPISAELAFPIATRPTPWLELALTPNLGLLRIEAEHLERQGMVRRGYTTVAAGFALGASFAVWRVRINPEINVVGVRRPDHDQGFLAFYPGVGVFLVY